MFRFIGLFVFAAMAMLAPSGCITLPSQQEEEAQMREDSLIMQENMQRLKGQIEGLQLEVDRLRNDVDALRGNASRSSQSDILSLQNKISDLDQRLRSLDAKSQRDKQEIVDKLSAKVAQVVGNSSSSRPKASTKKISSEGYEHVVQPGETLSAIAAAYNSRSADIIEANGLKDANQLRVGQKLFIPAP